MPLSAVGNLSAEQRAGYSVNQAVLKALCDRHTLWSYFHFSHISKADSDLNYHEDKFHKIIICSQGLQCIFKVRLYVKRTQFFLGLVQSCTKLLLVPSIWKIILEKSFCVSFCYFFQREKNINELWSLCCSELFLSSFTDEFIKQNSTRNKCYYEISRMNARVQILNIFF